jgi:hypothetical protein
MNYLCDVEVVSYEYEGVCEMLAIIVSWHMVKPYKVSPKLQNLLWSIGGIFHTVERFVLVQMSIVNDIFLTDFYCALVI